MIRIEKPNNKGGNVLWEVLDKPNIKKRKRKWYFLFNRHRDQLFQFPFVFIDYLEQTPPNE